MSETVFGGPAVRQRMLEESMRTRGEQLQYMQGRSDAIAQAVERVKATLIVEGETKERMLEAVAQRVADVGKPTAI